MEKSPKASVNRNVNSEAKLFTPKSGTKCNGFSPISVPVSPVSTSPQAGNLTGNPRRVRDNAADLYNLIQEWNSYQINGISIVTEVTSLKTTFFSESNGDDARSYPPGINHYIDKLDGICQNLSDVIKKIEIVCKELNGISKLEQLKKTNSIPMFLTWPCKKFVDTAEKIYAAYSKELQLKYYIKENIAHCSDKCNTVVLSSAWLYQPYIEEEINLIMEAMLKETSHR